MCRRSVKWVGTGDGNVELLAYGVAGPGEKCGPGTESRWTGDGKLADRGRKVVGPGTERPGTGKGKAGARKEGRGALQE